MKRTWRRTFRSCTLGSIAQGAIVAVLNSIYQEDFLGFSYGFRPKRSQHDALDALIVGIERKRVNWVLDLDVRDFFGTVSHEWLVRFLEHRIGDERVRVLDLWAQQWRAEFSLELHPQKTQLIEFGRHAAAERAKRGQGKQAASPTFRAALRGVPYRRRPWWRATCTSGPILVVRTHEESSQSATG
jgi:hypothetical protein